MILYLFSGNLIADITRNVTQADVSLVNSGTLRSDTIHSPGEFKMKVSMIWQISQAQQQMQSYIA